MDKKWKHRIYASSGATKDQAREDHLNDIGRDGWELVAVVRDGSMYKFYLKKQLTLTQ